MRLQTCKCGGGSVMNNLGKLMVALSVLLCASLAMAGSGRREGPVISTPKVWGSNGSCQWGTDCPAGGAQVFVSMYTTEAGADSADITDWEMGVVFEIDCAEFPSGGFLHGIKFHKQLNNTGIHTVSLWSNTAANTQHRTETVVNESLSGWQSQLFTTQGPFALTCGAPGYVASYTVPVGSYTFTSNYFQAIEPNIDGEDRNAPLYFPDTTSDGRAMPIGNARYSTTPGIAPVFTFSGASYWVDIIWSETE